MLSINLMLVIGTTNMVGAQEQFKATFYGYEYNGRRMGCGDIYYSSNPQIAAVDPTHYGVWSCGTQLEVIGPAGSIIVTRTDSCPGCSSNMIDLSESGIESVCGIIATCNVTVKQVE